MLNSIVVILRSIATKNPYSCLFHKYRLSGGRAAASRSGGPQTSGCRRACPASCARPTPTALLCHPERKRIDERSECRGRLRTMPSKEEKDKRSAVKDLFWARLQMFRCARHDICGRSSQRGKRQTKCNQESIGVRLQILRRYPLLRMTTLVVPIVAPRMTK